MKITVSHNKTPDEIRQRVDRGFEQLFQGLPIGPVQVIDQQRTWAGSTLNFSFGAKTPFATVPIKGFVLVEEKQITIDVDLPSFVSNFIPEAKIGAAVEGQVRGLLA